MLSIQRGVMGARIGSVTVLLLLIGVAQYCQASRDQAGSESTTTTKASIRNTKSTSGASNSVGLGTDTKSGVQNKVGDGLDKEEAADETGQIKFENLGATVMEGVLDAPAPSPSSAFSVLPALLTPALAVSLAVLAARMS